MFKDSNNTNQQSENILDDTITYIDKQKSPTAILDKKISTNVPNEQMNVTSGEDDEEVDIPTTQARSDIERQGSEIDRNSEQNFLNKS